jgi:hypothetical protein
MPNHHGGLRPWQSDIRSEDASTLLILLSFLKSEKIPLELLFRGATPRKRWNVQGEIEEVDAIHTGLVPESGSLLSDVTRLSNAFHGLDLLSTVSKNSDQTYTVDEAVVARIRESLSPELHSFWRFQALVIVSRSTPWKYIEKLIYSTFRVRKPQLSSATGFVSAVKIALAHGTLQRRLIFPTTGVIALVIHRM